MITPVKDSCQMITFKLAGWFESLFNKSSSDFNENDNFRMVYVS